MTSTNDVLQAILDLHQPGVRGIDVGLDYCKECRKIYPCQTVRLATANLRGGDPPAPAAPVPATEQRGKAQAWEEGWREGLNVGRDDFDALSLDENPYRADQEGGDR